MTARAASLYDHISEQLHRLCAAVGLTQPRRVLTLLRDVLGPAAERSVTEPPLWSSGVADDHTPIEFSVALDGKKDATLRILGESISTEPNPVTNLQATHTFINSMAERFRMSMNRFHRVQDLFLAADPPKHFALWYSLIFRTEEDPDVKIYFNPDARGRHRAPELIAEALRRLNLGEAYQTIIRHAVRPGQLGKGDRFSFFALDLHDRPRSRAKVYLSHYEAEAGDMMRASRAVYGIDPEQIEEFCSIIGGGAGPFRRRPLVSSYTFVEGNTDRPSGYSLYLPIRDYVPDDEEALHRVKKVLRRYDLDSDVIERAIGAVARRPLHEDTGLIAHVSLRLGPASPGVTVYLSSEAYRRPVAEERVPVSTPRLADAEPVNACQ